MKRAARAHGMIDPLLLLERLRRFAQPSEVQEPIELLRAGIAFHARGLINTRAIQHNLDWVWPYWVEKQFNPHDASFVPRAFSFSHINLTHRNWTAIGHPDLPLYPIVDPRGLVTPLYDGWSIDLWLITPNGDRLLPSKLRRVKQDWLLSPAPAVRTEARHEKMEIISSVTMTVQEGTPFLRLTVEGSNPGGGWLAAALRPYNPEGIQFIDHIRYRPGEAGRPELLINSRTPVEFDRTPARIIFSSYEEGDVIHRLDKPEDRAEERDEIFCRVGLANAAALFPLASDKRTSFTISVPLREKRSLKKSVTPGITPGPVSESWEKALAPTAELKIPDEKTTFLYQAAVRTLVLLSAAELVPGPYTYRRFWYRDACLMLNGLISLGLTERAGRILDTFPDRQKVTGYFQSQEGEWDSNGQVLWIMDRFQRITGRHCDRAWMKAVRKGADWIIRKRIRKKPAAPQAGLLPPGFSAEHLGPNDYYYWDDFWSLAGLCAAARLSGLFGSPQERQKYDKEALDFEKCIFDSIAAIPEHRSLGGMPASPYRRMDAGAIGSLVADYPLQLTPPGAGRIMKTVEFLMQNCFHQGAFFQDMIHSGVNIYLTLDIAQTLLRNGDSRYRNLMQRAAEMASATGQWPEAIHPLTGGGCMGDGQHGWAAAEWIMMIRNLFVREEGDMLVLGSGLLPEWTAGGETIQFGPTPTPFGPVRVSFSKKEGAAVFEIQTDFPGGTARPPDAMVIRVPGYREITTTDINRQSFHLKESPA